MSERGPLWRALRAAHDRLALVAPRAALALAGAAGALAEAVAPGERARLVEGLLGLPPGRARAVARRVASREFRGRALRRLILHDGIHRVAGLVLPDAIRRLRAACARRPLILLAWHVGPPSGVPAALVGAGVPALVITQGALLQGSPLLEVVPRKDGAAADAYFLKRAVERLRAGGVLALAPQGGGARAVEVRLLGRRARLRRGAAMLARTTGAPLLPIVSRWARGATAIDLVIGEPLPRPVTDDPVAFERRILQSAADWVEARMRRSPEEIRVLALRWLAECPLAGGSVAPAGRGALDPEPAAHERA